tara:strand:+ start:2002 stop:3735 length:1734 start_codon:yes stop_codon:yes gene_type:complete
MISLSQLNKLIFTITFLTLLTSISNPAISAEDIWKKKDDKKKQADLKEKITIESPILSDDINKISIQIDESKIENSNDLPIGIFDPEENNFSLDMWSNTNGEDIKNILKRISKIKLSKFSEDLLFKVLFTNSYPPKNNLTSEEFLKIKINWLIKNQRFNDLEILLRDNPAAGKESKAVIYLVNEHLSSANIKSACDKAKYLSKDIQNNYLEKFVVYCLIDNDQKNEAQLVLDLLKERGFNDKFFENKINFLLGISENSGSQILDDNLLNFYLSHVTSNNFEYEPNDKTDKYIWRYLSAANLIKVDSFENEDLITTYEKAAKENSFQKDEIFKIYLRISFNFNQLLNAQQIYKNLPSYKARALIYQSILLSENNEKKIDLAFLLKDLFSKDKLSNIYSEEFSNILKSIDTNTISASYQDTVNQHIDKGLFDTSQIKFDNDILHKSKILKHFIDDKEKLKRTEKDFKSVYKKIKKNKKYFISIKDVVVLESLKKDGINIPKDLDLDAMSSQLTIPTNLDRLVEQKKTGLVMLKIVEIIGEDDIHNLDPETIYFLNSILNKLNLKKIRNNILSEALPARV